MLNLINTSYSSDQSQLWRQLLQTDTNVTIFCPTNLAIETFCNQTFPGNTIEQCITDPQNGRMVEYLILNGQFALEDIKAAQPLFESTTYLNQGLAIQWAKCGDITQARLRATTNSSGTFLQGGVGSAALLPNQTNYQACGSYIHIIDQVLTPCPFFGNPQSRGCGAVWDEISANLGNSNITYQQLIQNTPIFQTLMQDVAWVGTAFPPSLNALQTFIKTLQQNGIVSGTSDPQIQTILDQVLRFSFTNGSTIFVSNGQTTKYTGGQPTTHLAPNAQQKKNDILVPSLATNFSACPNKISTNQTYILVTLDPTGAGNAKVQNYGYPNVTGTVSQPDQQGCSMVIQMIDQVLIPCTLQKQSSGQTVVFGTPSSSSAKTPTQSGSSQFQSLN